MKSYKTQARVSETDMSGKGVLGIQGTLLIFLRVTLIVDRLPNNRQ